MRFISFCYNSREQEVSGQNEHPDQTPWRGAQCSCIALRPTLPLTAGLQAVVGTTQSHLPRKSNLVVQIK